MKELRKRIWIDRLQTVLFVRIGAYCLIYQVVVWVILSVWHQCCAALESLLKQPVSTSNWLPALLGILVLTPVLMYDAVRFAHRIVGPLYRFRKTIQAIAEGEPVAPIQLRQGDLLLDMQDDFNKMIDALEKRGYAVKAPAEKAPQKQPQLV